MDSGPFHYGAHLIYQASEDTNVNAADVVPAPFMHQKLIPIFMNTRIEKKSLRNHAKRMRKGAAEMLGIQAAEDAAEHGMRLLGSLPQGAVVGAYLPIHDELDPRFLIHALERAGYTLALPVVTQKGAPLTFRMWGQGDPLEAGIFGTQQPLADAPPIVPAAMIVPLLAFDADCYRLGYGGGFYDRTLAQHSHIKAFGFAYGAQFVDDIKKEPHDWPLQGVITETGTVLPRIKRDGRNAE